MSKKYIVLVSRNKYYKMYAADLRVIRCYLKTKPPNLPLIKWSEEKTNKNFVKRSDSLETKS
jgi:hypothetical protein